MSKLLPPSRPLQAPAATAKLLLQHDLRDPVAVVACRGYYMLTMGRPDRNDRGFYDDAIIVFSSSCHVAFNANVDPSIFRKDIATLKPGVWRYQPGTHNISKPASRRYPAFVQAEKVTVLRDSSGDAHGHPDPAPYEDTGWFGINIHRGGETTTSSLGCQTIPPAQWGAFHALLTDQLKRYNQKSFPYLLTVDSRI
ncbi:MAG TPA: hypothetical protein VF614_02275 [Chthoniobacteraceae bacterium]|jgi:lysozyme